MSEIKVYLRHFKVKHDYCNRGLRAELKKHGISWNELVFNGISVDLIKNIKDARFVEIVEIVEKEATNSSAG